MQKGDYWERCWQTEDREALARYLEGYRGLDREEIRFLKEAGVRYVCDAACGFGAYTYALVSQGFTVEGFDLSATAAELTRENLKKLGYDVAVKVAELARTGYRDGQFDGVFAHAVIDHMTVEEARTALVELLRILRSGGLLLLSFDEPEEGDFTAPHELLPDGSLLYGPGSDREGMVFRPYRWEEIHDLVAGRKLVFETTNRKGERVVILEK